MTHDVAWLRPQDLADRWRVSTRTLERWRAAGDGPDWLRIGKKVVYRRADIRAFEAAQLRAPSHSKGGQS